LDKDPPMRPLMPLIFAVLGACATQDVGVSTGTARFPEFPTGIFSALKKSCSTPAQQYVRLSPTVAECREYLEPEATAAIILTYEGTTDDLPQLVLRLETHTEGSDTLLTTNAYLNVPQKTQGAIHVTFPSDHFDRTLQELYRESGGVPE
jgi:hypothetical protein